jgi:hypothetical protein
MGAFAGKGRRAVRILQTTQICRIAAARYFDRVVESLGPPEPLAVFVVKRLWRFLRQAPAFIGWSVIYQWLTGQGILRELCLGAVIGAFVGNAFERWYRVRCWKRRAE